MAWHCENARKPMERTIEKTPSSRQVPQHPADEQDDAAAKEVDTLALRDITADYIRFHFIAAQPRTRAQHSDAEKPRKRDVRSANQ